MTEYSALDRQNLLDNIHHIKETLKCTLCEKLPEETVAVKCHHPFCKTCVDKVLFTKRAVCPICKTVINTSCVRRVKSIDEIVKDLKTLCEAIEKDSATGVSSHKRKTIKQYQGKRKSLTLPGPSSVQIEQESNLRSESSTGKLSRQYNGSDTGAANKERRVSVDSEKTILIRNVTLTTRRDGPASAVPSTSRATENLGEPVFTTDNLAVKIEAIESKAKVQDWLYSEEFEKEIPENAEFPEDLKPQGSVSPTVSEVLESFSQAHQNSEEWIQSARNSPALKGNRKNGCESMCISDNGRKYKSFTTEARNKMKKQISKATTPAEKMFDEFCKITPEVEVCNKRSRVPSVSTETSWSALALLKKEARRKGGKRKRRLNISIERPSSSKLRNDSLDRADSEDEKEAKDMENMSEEDNASIQFNVETHVVKNAAKKRKKPNLVSARILDESEMFDIATLNRRQVKDIIGAPCSQANHDASKNSSNSLDRSSAKSTKNKLSLSKSGEHSRDISGKSITPGKPEEEATSHFEESNRPQSKQSFNANDSRPGSRLSCKSIDKSSSDRFILSTKRRSATPTAGTSEVVLPPNAAHPREEQEKIVLGSNSPIRTSNSLIRNKLSLKRLSSASSRTNDYESRSSIVSIKKMGKLYKPRNRIKFLWLGSTQSELAKKELQNAIYSSSATITYRDAQTQTSPKQAYSNIACNNASGKVASNESLIRTIITGTRTASTVSNDSRQIEEAQRPSANTRNSKGELDTVNKVNMLSPEKDSQLKFLDTKSPSVPRMNCLDADKSMQKDFETYSVSRKICSTNSADSLLLKGADEYLNKMKKYTENLVATDSEDQDTSVEKFGANEGRRNENVEQKNKLEEVVPSVTISSMSKMSASVLKSKMVDETETTVKPDVTNISESPSARSTGKNSAEKLSHASPKRKRYLRDSGSKIKRRSAQTLKSPVKMSGSYLEDYSESDTETILFKSKSKPATQHLEDIKRPAINARHKVVRELKYSQESGSNSSAKPEGSESSEQQGQIDKDKKSNRLSDKKSFQRIRQISSTDSENELLEISMTTKESSSNSQTVTRPGTSRNTNKSPILSEDMTIVFSSNKETQESKRKRSPSPDSLDNNDLQAIAANWCADLDRSSEEIANNDNKVLGISENLLSEGANRKKPRGESYGSPASFSSDQFPALSPTAIHGSKRKGHNEVENVTATNNSSLSAAEKGCRSSVITMTSLCRDEESELIQNLDEVASHFDEEIQPDKIGRPFNGTNLTSTNNTRDIGMECLMKQRNTFNEKVTSRNSTPVKAKSIESRNLSEMHRFSNNSDKENEVGNHNAKTEISARARQKVALKEDSNKLVNCRNDSSKVTPTNSTELFESSFDRDVLNITQEQILLQELEDNLLGQKSNGNVKNNSQGARQDKAMKESSDANTDQPCSSKKPSVNSVEQKVIGYQVAELLSDNSSSTMDEDIIESTPEKNLPSKKDLYTYVNNSQRSNASLKSFMSVDMTPIAKMVPSYLRATSDVSPLFEPNSKPSSNNHNLSKSLSAQPTRHSTPKPAASVVQKANLATRIDKMQSVIKKEQRLCFVCSCLSLPQIQNVKAFAQMHKVEYTASYKPEVTHVIVETDEQGSADRTLKYLFGVAHKKWIVSYRWVTDSMSQGKLLNEEDYEVVDSDTDEPGPRKSRLSKKGLFDDFAFVCMKPLSDITIDQLQDLLCSTGGTVLETLEELASATNRYKVILYNSELHELTVLEKWRRRGRGLPVQVEWVPSCISQYELVSFRYYVHSSDYDLAADLGFPSQFLHDEEDSYSVNEAT